MLKKLIFSVGPCNVEVHYVSFYYLEWVEEKSPCVPDLLSQRIWNAGNFYSLKGFLRYSSNRSLYRIMLSSSSSTPTWVLSAKTFFGEHLEPRIEVAKAQHRLLLDLAERVKYNFSARQVLSGEVLREFPLLAARIPGVVPIGDTQILESPHFVDSQLGLHICGKPFKDWLGAGRTAEELFYALWTGKDPSLEEAEAMRLVLKEARQSVVFPFEAYFNSLRSGIFPLLANHEVPSLHVICQHAVVYLSAITPERDDLITGKSPELESRFIEWVRATTVLSVAVPFAFRLFSEPDLRIDDFVVPQHERLGEVYAVGFGVSLKLASVFDMLTSLMVWHGKGNGSTFGGLLAFNFNASVPDALQAGFAVASGISHCDAASVCAYQMSQAVENLGLGASDEALLQWFKSQKTKVYAIGHPLLKGNHSDPRADIARTFLRENYQDDEWVSFALNYFRVGLIHLANKDLEFPHENVDAFTAVVLRCLGVIKDFRTATLAGVFFILSRNCGLIVEGFWDQAISQGRGFVPRPKTLTTQMLFWLMSQD